MRDLLPRVSNIHEPFFLTAKTMTSSQMESNVGWSFQYFMTIHIIILTQCLIKIAIIIIISIVGLLNLPSILQSRRLKTHERIFFFHVK